MMGPHGEIQTESAMDSEWVALMVLAKALGFTVQEVGEMIAHCKQQPATAE